MLTAALAAGGEEVKRAFTAMMTMRKIDVAAIEVARRGRRCVGCTSPDLVQLFAI